MNNAKDELLEAVSRHSIKCAYIYTDYDEEKFILKVDYTSEEFNNFLSKLDFKYDDGYGGQVLFGTVWLTDDTWLSRGEYDGSEWWEHYKLPEIPEECRQIDKLKFSIISDNVPEDVLREMYEEIENEHYDQYEL